MIVFNLKGEPFRECGLRNGDVYVSCEVTGSEDGDVLVYHVETWDGREMTDDETFTDGVTALNAAMRRY